MSNHPLPFSPACERNREPILARLRFLFSDVHHVLEIGSGTAQHATYFAASMPQLSWTCSDREENLATIRERVKQAALSNLREPLELDVRREWPSQAFEAVFSANTAHIMSWESVQAMLAGVGALLPARGRFALYGPFHYGGRPTSESNAAFDRDLLARGAGKGIRNIEDMQAAAAEHGLHLVADMAMPANNRLLAWEKQA